MTNDEARARVAHAAMRPELYETWQLDCRRSDANFYGMHEEEAELRAHVERRRALESEGRTPHPSATQVQWP